MQIKKMMWCWPAFLMAVALSAPVRAQLRVGQKMPAWSVRDLNGRTISSQTTKKKAVWITFFHST